MTGNTYMKSPPHVYTDSTSVWTRPDDGAGGGCYPKCPLGVDCEGHRI